MRKNSLLSKGIILGIIVLFVGTSIQSVMSTETPSVMTTSGEISGGNIWIVDDEGDGDYTSIMLAVENINTEAGDTIKVYSGTYSSHHVVVDKQDLTITGYDVEYPFGAPGDTGKPIVDGGSSGNVFYIGADGVTLEGFDIQGGENGIYVGSDDNYIYHNDIDGSFGRGIEIRGSSGNTIIGNTIEDVGDNGLYIHTDSNNNIIHHNNFNNTHGVTYYVVDGGANNIWNQSYNVYPSRGNGNYWSDFDEPDEGAYDDFSGPGQDESGSDGIVDNGTAAGGGLNPYFMWSASGDSKDMYPLVLPYGPLKAYAYGPYTGLINEPINFTGLAANGIEPYTYYWDFGDGNSSYGQNVAHIYTKAARDARKHYSSYIVTLTVNDSGGNTSDDTTLAKINLPVTVKDIKGGIGISVLTENTGKVNITDVNWTIAMEGMIFPKEKEGVIPIFGVGAETLKTGLLLGIGRVKITVTAGTETKTALAYALGPFVLVGGEII